MSRRFEYAIYLVGLLFLARGMFSDTHEFIEAMAFICGGSVIMALAFHCALKEGDK